MKIKRQSMVSGVVREMDLPITDEQYFQWEHGLPIQQAMPHLSASEREFVMTGITDDEWDNSFKE